MGAFVLNLLLVVGYATRSAWADNGTLIPIETYTDFYCAEISTITPKTSLGLDICAVTPGAGSVEIPKIPCTSGIVKVYAFQDTSCGKKAWSLWNNGCQESTAVWAAIQLSCGQDEPAIPIGTATIVVASIATNGASTTGIRPTATSSSSSGGLTSTGSTGDSSNSSSSGASGWNTLPYGAKIGIIIGGVLLFSLLLSLGAWNNRDKVANWAQEQRKRHPWRGPNSMGGYDNGSYNNGGGLSSKSGALSNATELGGNRDAESARAWLERLKNEVHPIFFPRELNVPPVRVAILDTGANFDERTSRYLYDNRIIDYWSWCSTPNSAQGKQMFSSRNRSILPEGRDLDGHGTHVMSVLLEVAPFCEVYIAKVFEGRNDMKDDVSSATTAQRVSNAIVHAVQHWEVDIISMSFGFPQEIEAVNRAINYATDGSRPILMFAAASNTGGNDHVQWPASHDRVMCIHATDGDGNKYGLNPTPEGKPHEFATLGCSVESWLGPSHRASRSGTSVATPIAAGVAALLLDYMRAKRDWYLDHTVSEHNHDPATRQSVRNWQAAAFDQNMRRLGMVGGMSAVFTLMSGRSRDGYQYIRPWSVLHNRYNHVSALIHKIGSAVDHRNR